MITLTENEIAKYGKALEVDLDNREKRPSMLPREVLYCLIDILYLRGINGNPTDVLVRLDHSCNQVYELHYK